MTTQMTVTHVTVTPKHRVGLLARIRMAWAIVLARPYALRDVTFTFERDPVLAPEETSRAARGEG